MQDTKKFGCLAQIKMKEIFLFSAFKVCLSFLLAYKESLTQIAFLCEGYFTSWSSAKGILLDLFNILIKSYCEWQTMIDVKLDFKRILKILWI